MQKFFVTVKNIQFTEKSGSWILPSACFLAYGLLIPQLHTSGVVVHPNDLAASSSADVIPYPDVPQRPGSSQTGKHEAWRSA